MPRHEYPGAGHDLRYNPQNERDEPFYPIGAHTNCIGAESTMLQVREVAMMILMDSLTDKPGWEDKVFDDGIIAKWRKEAMEQSEAALYSQIANSHIWKTIGADGTESEIDGLPKPRRARIMSEKAFDYCVAELRNKASFFKQSKLIPTLDSDGQSIVKSDCIVDSTLREELKAAFDKLCFDQQSNVDWHPRSDNMVQDLVHPSMYPLVYGQSRFFQDEVVGVSDAIEKWAGKGEVLPREVGEVTRRGNHNYNIGGSKVPPEYWSNKFQWLPANLAFQEDGRVKFVSYINNLHPRKYPGIYQSIEKLIDVAIPAWDLCLSRMQGWGNKIGHGRRGLRFAEPEDCDDENDEIWENFDEEILAANDFELKPGEREELEYSSLTEQQFKWKKLRDPILPEPNEFEKVEYSHEADGGIKQTFKKSGLQIIVKLATIELTPEKPDFPIGGWHIEGQMNEHICATALYYLDSQNITSSQLSFRMQTSSYQDELQDNVGQDQYHYLERIFGTELSGAECIQNYGSVETCGGRLLAFPNTFQHRVSPFSLKDKTKPGHRRFIALWLVDPHVRIVSTGNVPPQQLEWWAEAIFGTGASAEKGDIPSELWNLLLEKGLDKKFPVDAMAGGEARLRLSPELIDMVRKEGVLPEGLMSTEEAKKLRLELMDERTRFHDVSASDWRGNTYSFCEH